MGPETLTSTFLKVLTRAGRSGTHGSTALLRNYKSKFDDYTAEFAKASERARDASAPLFIPTFTGLRRTIVEHLTANLQRLEHDLSSDSLDAPAREESVADAVTLLRHVGRYQYRG